MMRGVPLITILIWGVLSITPVFAGYLPCNIGDLEIFPNNSKHFKVWKNVDKVDFSSEWVYKTIGFESGHINTNHKSNAMTAGKPFPTTGSASLGGRDNHYFELYRLTADSNVLGCLKNQLPLSRRGINIIDFNDHRRFPRDFNDNRQFPGGDPDNNDIILAGSQTAPVPEPANLLLLGSGLLGLAGYMRKVKK